MSVDTLLSRLESVRKRGAEQWSARCPAHDDKGPSLSVRALPDGRTLVHCFAGCGADEVLGAMGLEMEELFPPKAPPGEGMQPVQRRSLITATQALELVERELRIIFVVIANIRAGLIPTDDDWQRFIEGAGRIETLIEEVSA